MDHFDAIVVGSGFGGSVTAYRLAEAGKRVLVLERGRAYPPGSFTRSPYRARESFWDPPHGLTGMYQGQPTVPFLTSSAQMFGTWGAPTPGQETLASQAQAANYLGQYQGTQTQQAQQQAFAQAQALIQVLNTDQNWRGLVQALTFAMAGIQRNVYTLDEMTRPLTMFSTTIEDVMAGKPANTPIALVEDASLPTMRVQYATLRDLPEVRADRVLSGRRPGPGGAVGRLGR